MKYLLMNFRLRVVIHICHAAELHAVIKTTVSTFSFESVVTFTKYVDQPKQFLSLV